MPFVRDTTSWFRTVLRGHSGTGRCGDRVGTTPATRPVPAVICSGWAAGGLRWRPSADEDLVQGLGELPWAAAEAAVVAGEGHRRRAQPFGQRERRAVGQLVARCGFTNADDGPDRAVIEGDRGWVSRLVGNHAERVVSRPPPPRGD